MVYCVIRSGKYAGVDRTIMVAACSTAEGASEIISAWPNVPDSKWSDDAMWAQAAELDGVAQYEGNP